MGKIEDLAPRVWLSANKESCVNGESRKTIRDWSGNGNKETLGQRVIRYMELLGTDATDFMVELSITKSESMDAEELVRRLNSGEDEVATIVDHAAKHDTFKKFIEDGILVDRMNEYWLGVSERDEK